MLVTFLKKPKVIEKEPEPAPLGRILKLNAPEMPLLITGCVGAALQGGIFPSLAFILAEILGVSTSYTLLTILTKRMQDLCFKQIFCKNLRIRIRD